MPRLEQPEPSQHSATGKEAGKPEPSTRTVVPATPEAGLTLREAARAGAAVTSCKPSDRTKSTSQPAIRPPIDRPCLGNPGSHESLIYLLDRVGHTLVSPAQNTGARAVRDAENSRRPDLEMIRRSRARSCLGSMCGTRSHGGTANIKSDVSRRNLSGAKNIFALVSLRRASGKSELEECAASQLTSTRSTNGIPLGHLGGFLVSPPLSSRGWA